jgi:hypothetical protein
MGLQRKYLDGLGKDVRPGAFGRANPVSADPSVPLRDPSKAGRGLWAVDRAQISGVRARLVCGHGVWNVRNAERMR